MADDAVDKVQEVAGEAIEKAGDMAYKAKNAASDAENKVRDMMSGRVDGEDARNDTSTATEQLQKI